MLVNFNVLVDDFRREHGLDEEFNREVNEIFKDRILSQYRKGFEEFLRKRWQDWDEVGRVLRSHRGTVSRWMKNEIRPELDTIFLYLAATNASLAEVGFPSGKEAVLCGLAETLMKISNKIKENKSIDGQRVETLRFAMGHPTLINRDMKSIIEGLRQHCPHIRIPTIGELEGVIRDWFVPWTLLCDCTFRNFMHAR